MNQSGHYPNARLRQQLLPRRWDRLCARFLPVTSGDTIWRYSRVPAPDDPQQGWKIHIAATVLTANRVMERVGPFLNNLNILFKAPRSLHELSRLNCGLFYGFSQVGKFVTVYPRSTEHAVSLARELTRLTNRLIAPAVPYDLRFQNSRCVFYRYGAFDGSLEIVNEDGTRLPAVRNPKGELVEDQRTPGAAAPPWLINPFPKPRSRRKASDVSPLKTTIRAFEALSQRGKGGVYRALDLSVLPARLCVLKEGRRHGETDWDGRDGFWRVRHEGTVLAALSAAGVPVPEVYLTFQTGQHCYLATEFIDGENLQSLLSKKGKLSVLQALKFGTQIAETLAQIHDAGWVWRDCKPLNLMVSKDGSLRPLDFEGSCPIDRSDPMPWGTEGYVPPEFANIPASRSRLPEDLYALGATLRQLLSGQTPKTEEPRTQLPDLGPRVPAAIKNLVAGLLDPTPQLRPSARVASQVLTKALSARRNAKSLGRI
ncbi:MAG: phosphotransferase [Acidobacteriota bacterium]|nr:phosphotransferase [Acidobacteriota bacterium]